MNGGGFSIDSYEMRDAAGRLWRWDSTGKGTVGGYCFIQSPDTPVACTVELGGGVQVDYDADGNAIGIEFV